MRTIPKQTIAITLGALLVMSISLSDSTNAQTVLGPGDLGAVVVTIEDDYAYPQNGDYDYGLEAANIKPKIKTLEKLKVNKSIIKKIVEARDAILGDANEPANEENTED